MAWDPRRKSPAHGNRGRTRARARTHNEGAFRSRPPYLIFQFLMPHPTSFRLPHIYWTSAVIADPERTSAYEVRGMSGSFSAIIRIHCLLCNSNLFVPPFPLPAPAPHPTPKGHHRQFLEAGVFVGQRQPSHVCACRPLRSYVARSAEDCAALRANVHPFTRPAIALRL